MLPTEEDGRWDPISLPQEEAFQSAALEMSSNEAAAELKASDADGKLSSAEHDHQEGYH